MAQEFIDLSPTRLRIMGTLWTQHLHNLSSLKYLSPILTGQLTRAPTLRCEGRGPRFIKIGGTLVRYKPEDVETWLNASPSGGNGQRISNGNGARGWEGPRAREPKSLPLSRHAFYAAENLRIAHDVVAHPDRFPWLWLFGRLGLWRSICTAIGVPQITLNIGAAFAREVIRALETRAAYTRGYWNDAARAQRLDNLAAHIRAQIVEANPDGRETGTATNKKEGP
jgi:hypothetical protein